MNSFQEINAQLIAKNIAQQWFPQAARDGRSLRLGNLQGEKGSSLWICRRTGAWKDHATGDSGGDLISLYAAMQNLSQGEALKQVKRMLGCSDYGLPDRPHGTQQDKKRIEDQESKFNIIRAKKIWEKTQPIEGTQAESYLRGRGIVIELPITLRFHPDVWHWPTKKTYPALIAAVTVWPSREVNAIHQTFLNGDKKADIPKNKLRLASALGGAVRLAPVKDVLAVAEGIETALSFQQMTGLPTWPVLSSSNYCNLILPDIVQEIIIAADNDQGGNGLTRAKEAADKWARQGYKVKTFPPENEKDWNDVLKKEQGLKL